jgi:ABC-type spermidine/putrescine transport system permease subunit I
MRRLAKYLLVAPAVALLAIFIVFPSADTFLLSVVDPDLGLKHFSAIADAPVYVDVLFRTMAIAALVTLGALVLGYPVAYFIFKQPAKAQVPLLFLILIPMWMSVLIRSYTWITLLGREGVINSLLLMVNLVDSPLKLIYTNGAVCMAMIQILIPIQIINSYTGMKEIDLDLMRAARVMGASSYQAMRRVFIPMSMDGTITGASIVFMTATGFFITPALIGGSKTAMLGNMISYHVERQNTGFAAALGVLLVAVSLVCVFIIRRLGRSLAARMI